MNDSKSMLKSVNRLNYFSKLNMSLMRLSLSLFFIAIIIFARYAILTQTTIWLWDLSITFALACFVYLFRKRLQLSTALYFFFLFALFLHDLGVYGMYTKTVLGLNYDNYTHFFGSFAVAMILFNWIAKTKFCRVINLIKVGKAGIISNTNKITNTIKTSKINNTNKTSKTTKTSDKRTAQKTAHLEYKKRISHKTLSIGTICFITILMVLGISAIHESIEFLGYTYLNADGPNLFFPGNVPVASLTNKISSLTNLPTLTLADIGTSGSYQNTMIDIIYNAVGALAGCAVMGAKRIIR
ncbi:hypothetical protein HY636_03260 [Candidatus Woesearchaeota archaeon]|nr:hypothetical protein [Candidatus Woesearchaeota archaeon]